MGRKKELNPMDAYRRKQKQQQNAKNKKKRSDAKQQALQKRTPEWIRGEMQKLNRREKQDRGKNEEKHEHQRKQLLEAYNRAERIQKIRAKTQTKSAENNEDEASDDDHAPTPPPIEGLCMPAEADAQDAQEEETDAAATASHPETQSNQLNYSHPPLIGNTAMMMAPYNYPHPHNMYAAHPLALQPAAYALSAYPIPDPAATAAIYSDAFGSKSSHANNPATHSRHCAKDTFDPMNPTNPKYNFLHGTQQQPIQHQPQHASIQPPPPSISTHGTASGIIPAQQPSIETEEEKEDITKMSQPKHEIEVIMNPKLKAMMPSSMRFKRKFQTQNAAPSKKRKLNIAPDVDDSGKHDKPPQQHRNAANNNNVFGTGNADAAYDKFMDEISGLL